MIWVQLLIGGILLGGIYALLAVGLNLIFGVMRVVNFAHGEFLMIGAMITAWLAAVSGMHPLIGLLVAVAIMLPLGMILQRFVIERLVSVPPVMSLLVTYGLSIILVNIALLVWGGASIAIPTATPEAIELGFVSLPEARVVPFVIAMTATAAVFLFLRYHSFGKALRSVSQDQSLAAFCGINARRVRIVTFAIGAALAGIAGALLAPIFTADFQMGERFLIKAFAIVIIGGLGSFPGALLGGLLIGIVEVTGGFLIAPTAANAVIFLVMIIVLLFRPQGLLGTRTTL